MVVVSTLRAAGTGLRCLKTIPERNLQTLLPARNVNSVLARFGHGGNTMQPLPSRFEWRRWKDHVHFFVALGLIPIGALVTTVNIFHGRCELAEIPEGYEPKHWEYYNHPIQRWFARYVYDSPEKIYERHLHYINVENQKRILRLTENKVRHLMGERQDVKGWYYVGRNDRRVYVAREFYEEVEETTSSPKV